MTLVLILLLQVFPQGVPSAPAQVCTVTGLKLPTTVMTWDQARLEAEKVFGSLNVLQWSNGGQTFYMGIRTQGNWVAGQNEPNPKICFAPNCFKNTNGSWRSLWNAVLIDRCKRTQGHGFEGQH
jgi:hypothetical protein